MKTILKIKNVGITFLILFITTSVYAQDVDTLNKKSKGEDYQTIFSQEKVSISGFGGLFMNFSALDGKYGNFLGAGGGILINDFFFGGYGMGLTHSIESRGDISGNSIKLDHGGFWLGYSCMANHFMHPSFHIKTGWGLLQAVNDVGEDQKSDDFFVLSPTIELEMNVARFFRIGMGVNYNLFYGVNLAAYENTDLNSLGGHIALKFGRFDK